MKKGSLYSSSLRVKPATPPVAPRLSFFKRICRAVLGFDTKNPRLTHFAASVLFAALAVLLYALATPAAQHLTQKDINDSVTYTLEHRRRPPAVAAVAAETIRPSVVRVNGYAAETDENAKDGKPVKKDTKPEATLKDPKDPNARPGDEKTAEDEPESVGSGVIIDDKGTILTNLHVAASAARLKVIFYNGMESDAEIVGAQPEDDLAVIRAKVLPDDIMPATLASTKGLLPGDTVVAVGFPFGIGPSVSSGVVSGLKREYVSEGKTKLKNLVQFDAAANPGNSGGPLVNQDGEVLGIVTGILNPTGQRVFAGIGFAVPIENAAAAAGMSPF